PLVTLWVFLSQVLSQDHSCRAAVARLIAHRVLRGQGPCSSETGAYCRARKRLPEEFFSNVARQTGRALERGVDGKGLWKSPRVPVYCGLCLTVRRSRCPIRLRTSASIPNLTHRNPAWVFRSPESRRSSRSPAEQFWTW